MVGSWLMECEAHEHMDAARLGDPDGWSGLEVRMLVVVLPIFDFVLAGTG